MNTPESILKERHKCVSARSLYYTLKILNERREGIMSMDSIIRQLPDYMDLDEWELAPISNDTNEPCWLNIYKCSMHNLDVSGCAYSDNNNRWHITEHGREMLHRFDGKPFMLYGIIGN